MKLLSIDDSRAVHAFLDRCNEQEKKNIQFIHAYSVEEGLNVLKKEDVDLVLLDWEMPGINGADGLPMIRKSSPDVPVVILTTKNDPADIELMLNRGAVEYILKPFTPDILFSKLDSVLN